MLFGDEYESYLGHDNCYSIPILSTSSSGGGSTCDSSYKYTCTYSSSTHISGGSGSSCGGKYKACVCDSSLGYSWDSYTGTCKKSLSSSSSSSSGGSLTPNIFVCGPSGPCTANTSKCQGGAFSSYALAEQECASRCSNGTTGQLTYLGISNRLFGEVIAVCDYKCICT